MIKLTNRLSACASLVRHGARLADIGCDHGYIPVYLVSEGIIPSAVAADINEGPLSSCMSLVRMSGLKNSIKCVISDGLESVSENEVDDILIAGMGGELIADILSRCPYAKKKHLVLNPMTHPELARKWLYENGFDIDSDIVVSDSKHHYSVFDAHYTGKTTAHSKSDYYLGNIKDFSDRDYFLHLIHYLENKQKGGEDFSAVISDIKEKKMTTVKNIYDYINSIAPYSEQEEWDNSGHFVGDFRAEVKKCVMALDATKAVCSFAKDIGADLVLTHHPIIFSGIRELKADSAVYILANAGISALCAHTNFDVAKGGINDNLASLLGLKNTEHIDGALIVCGELDTPMSIDDFAEYVSDTLGVAGIRYTDTDKSIKRVAVGGGACGEYAELAAEYADCFVTGDMKYHEMLDASEGGFCVISAGHFETENEAFLMLKNKLEGIFTDVEFIIAPVDNPIKSI